MRISLWTRTLLLAIGCQTLPIAQANMEFRVFFRENSCEVTSEAESVIATFVTEARGIGYHHIVVEATAGEEGSHSGMVRLSQCRGDAVKAALVRRGLDAASIQMIAKGDGDPWPRSAEWTPTLDRRALMYFSD
jgi:outer membrane protein OmpA-like peptidoglycan-associated protein